MRGVLAQENEKRVQEDALAVRTPAEQEDDHVLAGVAGQAVANEPLREGYRFRNMPFKLSIGRGRPLAA